VAEICFPASWSAALVSPAGGKATGLGQVPESLFPLLDWRNALPLMALDIVVGVSGFFVGEMLLSRLLCHFHLRPRPY
jgi:hypothetical protein